MAGEREQDTSTISVDIGVFRKLLLEAVELAKHRLDEDAHSRFDRSSVDSLGTDMDSLSAPESHVKHTGTPYVLRIRVSAHLDVQWIVQLADRWADGDLAYLWCSANEEVYLAGCGTATEITASGLRRFQDIQEQMADYVPLRRDEEGADEPPLWFGGYAFATDRRGFPWDNWPDARFVMARWQFQSGANPSMTFQTVIRGYEDLAGLVETVVSEAEQWASVKGPELPGQPAASASDSSRRGERGLVRDAAAEREASAADETKNYHDWAAAVEATAQDIRNGAYRKTVLARCQPVALPGHFDVPASIQYLISTYPESVAFIFVHGDEAFMGASPERLVSVTNGEVHVDCLAGSIRRGATTIEDDALGTSLLTSGKDLHEHAVVVDWVVTSISDCLTDVTLPSEPTLRKLANVQHLYTPVGGRLASGGVLRLVEKLHPTPAVAGDPREQALAIIAQRESTARGWYAGALGMVSQSGDGAFLVGLRSALLTASNAYLFAGGGIMAESNALREWQETQWKMRPMEAAIHLSQEGSQT